MFILETSACTDASVLATILFIKKLVKILSIIVPAILIVLLSIDFTKAVIANDDNGIKRAQKLAIKRLIYGAIVFFIPMIVNVSFSLLDSNDVSKSCFTNATDEVVDALVQADKEKLIAKEEDRKAIITAMIQDHFSYKETLKQLRDDYEASFNGTKLKVWFNALEEQYKWSKNSKYYWVSGPTVENSKSKGTCVTYVGVALQRAKLLPEAKYIYVSQSGKASMTGTGASYVKDHPEIFSYSFPNKTPKELYKSGELKPGDILAWNTGSSGHIMVFAGTDKNGDLLWDTGGHTKCINCTYNYYVNKKARMLVRIKMVS